jgi:pyridoxal phosphate enzyme (YggS family)
LSEAAERARERLDIIRREIERASKRFGGPPDRAELVAVSKTFPAEDIEPFLEAGHRVFGENRVQEAKAKWPALKEKFPGVELHLIGPLQTNKVKDAVALFDVIETLDRERLAEALRAEFDRTGKSLPLFVQVNIGEEPQKSGVAPVETVNFCRMCVNVHGLNVVGLMCIPPEGVPAGPYFAHLATLAREAGVKLLSMGMSGDFPVAVEMGATHVRVGSALFGRRIPAMPAGPQP